MGKEKPIYVVLDRDGEPVAASLYSESAREFCAKHRGSRFVKVPRVEVYSATSISEPEETVTEAMVDSAISAKLAGVSLTKFAKARGVRYDVLRDRVNAKWGYTRPWPRSSDARKGEPKGEPKGEGKWKNNKALFDEKK